MNFLNPFFLLGLLAVAIPVLIHLMNLRRPRKLAFSTLAFFEALKKSTIRRIRIKQYLLLALRVAAVLMLALALARPLLTPSLGGSSGGAPKTIAVIVDNSPSMSRIGAEGPFLDQAKEVVRKIIEGSNSGDQFLITGTNSSAQGMQLVNSARAFDLTDELEISNTGNQIVHSIRMITDHLQNTATRQAVIYLITDGQKSQLTSLEDLNKLNSREAGRIGMQIVNVGSATQPNIAVSDIQLKSRMLSKGNPVALQVEVKNFGNAGAANQFISLEVGNRMIGQYEAELEPGETQQFLFEIVPQKVGDIAGKIVIEGDEITFDNERYFVISIPKTRSVLLVKEDKSGGSEFISYLQPALEAARRSNTQIEFARQKSQDVDQSKWLQHDIIILDGLKEIPEYWFEDLQRFVQEGNGLLFFPSEQGNIENYNKFLGLFNAGRFSGIRGEYASFKAVARLGSLVEGHPILEGIFVKNDAEDIQVDLPELFFYYQFEQASDAGSFNILTSSIEDEILIEQRFGDGRLLVSMLGTDPGWSNFPVNALFAPIYYRSVLYASSSEQGGLSRHELGNEFEWNGNVENRSIELRLKEVTYKPEVQTIPRGVKISYNGREWKPGILHINSPKEEHLVAVNQNILESDFETLTQTELENLLDKSLTISDILNTENLTEEDLVNRLRSASMGREIWNWFVWIALLLLITETIISKLYKAESIS